MFQEQFLKVLFWELFLGAHVHYYQTCFKQQISCNWKRKQQVYLQSENSPKTMFIVTSMCLKKISYFILHSFFSLQQNEVYIKPEKAEATLVTWFIPSCIDVGRVTQVWCAGDSQPCTDPHINPKACSFWICTNRNSYSLQSVHWGNQWNLAAQPKCLGLAGRKQHLEAKSFMGWGGWKKQEKSLLYVGDNKTKWRMSMVTLTKAAERAEQSVPVAVIY